MFMGTFNPHEMSIEALEMRDSIKPDSLGSMWQLRISDMAPVKVCLNAPTPSVPGGSFARAILDCGGRFSYRLLRLENVLRIFR